MTIHAKIGQKLNLKIGDTIKVTHIVPDHDLGWKLFWPSDMNDYVGKEFTVLDINESYGVKVGERLSRWVPFQVVEKVESIEEENIQIELIKSLNLKKGDIVKITHKVPDKSLGWTADWIPHMDEWVGKECVVETIYNDEDCVGISLYKKDGASWDKYSFPAQCLQVIERDPIKKVKISESYTAQIYPGEKIVVGCQTITKDIFEQIQKEFNSK